MEIVSFVHESLNNGLLVFKTHPTSRILPQLFTQFSIRLMLFYYRARISLQNLRLI